MRPRRIQYHTSSNVNWAICCYIVAKGIWNMGRKGWHTGANTTSLCRGNEISVTSISDLSWLRGPFALPQIF